MNPTPAPTPFPSPTPHRRGPWALAGVVSALAAGLFLAASCAGPATPAMSPAAVDPFTPAEIDVILTLSPLPPAPPSPTNRFADDPAAARLGQALFFDTRLSRDGTVSCATCHDPGKNFTDGEPVPTRFNRSLRHTPALWNVAYNRWYFWDGRADSLWSQALIPLENPSEHATTRAQVAQVIAADPALRAAYRRVFGSVPQGSPAAGDPAPPADPTDRVFANVGKAIEAYERRLVSRRSDFDVFVEGVRERDAAKQAALSPSARRGLRLFIGRGNCRSCHHGPNFTDGEFHDTGVARVGAAPPPDPGRFGGVITLMQSPFNAQGPFSDAGDGKRSLPTSFLVNSADWNGQFKTPTLRNVAVTAPYMHRGQFATLAEVVRFYSALDVPPPPAAPGLTGRPGPGPGHTHAGGEHVLAPLHLSKDEADDLVAFLESLTDTAIDPALCRPPASPD